MLANELYVAMTRARSLLALFTGSRPGEINEALRRCNEQLSNTPEVDLAISARDEFRGLLDILGDKHGQWLYGLLSSHHIVQEPIVAPDGEVIAEPVFWLTANDHGKHACFGSKTPSQATLARLADLGVVVLPVGATVP